MINEVEPLKISIELQLCPQNHNIPEVKSINSGKSNYEYLRSTVGISAESIDVLIKSIVNDHKQKTRLSGLAEFKVVEDAEEFLVWLLENKG